jgi:hypothetical protein
MAHAVATAVIAASAAPAATVEHDTYFDWAFVFLLPLAVSAPDGLMQVKISIDSRARFPVSGCLGNQTSGIEDRAGS